MFPIVTARPFSSPHIPPFRPIRGNSQPPKRYLYGGAENGIRRIRRGAVKKVGSASVIPPPPTTAPYQAIRSRRCVSYQGMGRKGARSDRGGAPTKSWTAVRNSLIWMFLGVPGIHGVPRFFVAPAFHPAVLITPPVVRPPEQYQAFPKRRNVMYWGTGAERTNR